MDLIYSNSKHEDIGVLFDCTFDLAFGRNENNFELTMALESHCMEQGYFVFIEGTEYGGVVDSIRVDTDADTVTYCGRTWHGILAGNIIEPDKGYDHLTVSGDANEILALLVERLDLGGVFAASSAQSPIQITQYQFRYKDGYSGICEMLAQFGGKLRMIHLYDKVILSAVHLRDFSQDEEWDSTQVDMDILKNFRPVNHLVCLGSGDLKDRHVIHLFVDSGGGIVPYATTDNPVEDADYCLDHSRQVLHGADEVTAVYDYPQAATATNFVQLTEQPSDWSDHYGDYFKQDGNGGYAAVEGRWVDNYTVLTTQPSDWSYRYANYFALSGGRYRSVEGVETASYTVLNQKPQDWETNFGSYYMRDFDGTTERYVKVSGGDSVEEYKVLTTKPSDWETNFRNYYSVRGETKYKDEYVPVTQDIYDLISGREAAGETTWGKDGQYLGFKSVNIYQKNTESYSIVVPYIIPEERPADWDTNWGNYYYKTMVESDYFEYYVPLVYCPTWEPGKYYTKGSQRVVPPWYLNYYYAWTGGTTAPAFVSGLYYSKEKVFCCPSFVQNRYFRKTFDHFKELVEGGVKRLKELMTGDSVKVDLDLQGSYDIGDIVGAYEQTTGISVWQPITKKIVSIKDGLESITYEIGGS